MASLLRRHAARFSLRPSRVAVRGFRASPARFDDAAPEAVAAPEKEVVEAKDPKVISLIDEIMSLNLLQVNELNTVLKDRFGYVEAAPMAMAMAAAPAAEAEGEDEEEEVVRERVAFHVKLESFEPSAKIKIIKEVRSFISGLGLKESKELVESAPALIAQDMPKEDAEAMVEKINAVGGVAMLE